MPVKASRFTEYISEELTGIWHERAKLDSKIWKNPGSAETLRPLHEAMYHRALEYMTSNSLSINIQKPSTKKKISEYDNCALFTTIKRLSIKWSTLMQKAFKVTNESATSSHYGMMENRLSKISSLLRKKNVPSTKQKNILKKLDQVYEYLNGCDDIGPQICKASKGSGPGKHGDASGFGLSEDREALGSGLDQQGDGYGHQLAEIGNERETRIEARVHIDSERETSDSMSLHSCHSFDVEPKPKRRRRKGELENLKSGENSTSTPCYDTTGYTRLVCTLE